MNYIEFVELLKEKDIYFSDNEFKKLTEGADYISKIFLKVGYPVLK
jgi:hypothetical protein